MMMKTIIRFVERHPFGFAGITGGVGLTCALAYAVMVSFALVDLPGHVPAAGPKAHGAGELPLTHNK
jgi:hypothetical protein